MRLWLALAVVCSAGTPRGSLPGDGRTVLIEGGRFRMGTADAEIAELRRRYQVSFRGSFEGEVHAHDVELSSFRLDAVEVTNASFGEFVRAEPRWGEGRKAVGKADHPVTSVTWNAAQAYCRWKGGRLPTEAEWEFAAQGREGREFPWGPALPSPHLANYGASGLGGAVAVGSYPPSPLGLHDMAGNVWEWVLDAWEPNYAPAAVLNPVAGDPVPDSLVASVAGRRVIRGGSFGGAVVNLRTRWRDSHEAANARDFVGFRCAYPGQ